MRDVDGIRWALLPCGKHWTALYRFCLHGPDKVYCMGCDELFPATKTIEIEPQNSKKD